MRNFGLAAAVGAALAFGTLTAQAMPANAVDGGHAAPDVTFVAGGCGPGFHPNPWGRCRPNGGGWGPRCWIRSTPWGPRRVCR
jgi:hypothetical protein